MTTMRGLPFSFLMEIKREPKNIVPQPSMTYKGTKNFKMNLSSVTIFTSLFQAFP